MKVESSASKLKKNIHENEHGKKLLKIKTKEMVEKISNLQKRKESVNESLEVNETGELLIKNNKRKHYDNHGLRIASVGNEPILKVDTSKKKPPVNLSAANLRRLQSLNTLKKSYQNQKFLIQTALSKVDNSPKNKIIFKDNIDSVAAENLIQKKKSKKNLFDNQSEDEEFEANFDIKEQFQGKEGQKLLELQSKYKNDKRFVLDSRFLDNNETGDQEINNEEENEENSLEAEKKKEYEILEQILGKKISKPLHKNELESQKKAMLRFDPTQPEHLKFEIKEEVKKKKKRKSRGDEVEVLSKKITEEKELPTVSKETFYKVTNNLKESLHKKQDFSLLNMFGKADEREEDQNTEQFSKNLSTNSFTRETNPFKYDSSDDEDETGHIPDKNVLETEKSLENLEAKMNSRIHWTEPFFFKHDDYRLQEGFDFIEKMRSEENIDFSKLRRDVKEIVKAKVRNVQRKHKPFKKKLGGNKRRKMLRMKKALKR